MEAIRSFMSPCNKVVDTPMWRGNWGSCSPWIAGELRSDFFGRWRCWLILYRVLSTEYLSAEAILILMLGISDTLPIRTPRRHVPATPQNGKAAREIGALTDSTA